MLPVQKSFTNTNRYKLTDKEYREHLSQIITNNQPVNEYYLKPFGGFDQTETR